MSHMGKLSPIKVVGNWTLEEIIGKGAQATVYRAVNRDRTITAAIKEVSISDFDENALKQVKSEVELIKNLHHQFIIRLLDSFQGDGYFYIAYEYIERGSLYKAIKTRVFAPDVARRIIREVLLGLSQVHGKGIVHRDIKADNILIDNNNNIKIADFGISLIKGSIQQDSDNMTEFGSPYWMAPEVIKMLPPTTKSDIWSVGCLTLEILTGKPPYFDLPPVSALYHICYDPFITFDDPYHNISQECMQFIMECFERDPEKRKSAPELLNHAWFKPHGIIREKRISFNNEASRSPILLNKPMNHGLTNDKPKKFTLPPRNYMKLNLNIDHMSNTKLSTSYTANTTQELEDQQTNDLIEEEMSSKEFEELNSLDIDSAIDEVYNDIESNRLNTTGSTDPAVNASIPCASLPSATNFTKSYSSHIHRCSSLSYRSNTEENSVHNEIESDIIMNIQIVNEATHQDNKQSDTVIITALESLLKSISTYSFTCSVIVNYNGLYPLINIVTFNINNLPLCLLAVKILKEVMKHDSSIYMSLTLMGLLSIISRYISTYFESSSNMLCKGQLNQIQSNVSNSVSDQIMLTCVQMLHMLCSSTPRVIDIIFASGLINSAIQLLDSTKLCYVDYAIKCLIQIYNTMSSLSSDIVIDMIFRKGVVKFLYSGLIYCMTINSNSSYLTASHLLAFLTLYSEQDNQEYIKAVINNNGLETVLYALQTKDSTVNRNSLTSSQPSNTANHLSEYKLKVLKLMKNLHSVKNNLFDLNVLNYLLPLLQNDNIDIVICDIDLIYALIKNDNSQVILNSAIKRNIILTIQNLIRRPILSITEKATSLLLLIGNCCLKQSPYQTELFKHFKETMCCDYLFEALLKPSLCSASFTLLRKLVKFDKDYITRLSCSTLNIQILINCYAMNSQTNNDNIYSFIEFVQKIPDLMIILSQTKVFMKRVINNLHTNEMNQNNALVLLYSICKTIPHLTFFLSTYNIPTIVNSIRETESNSKARRELLRLLNQ